MGLNCDALACQRLMTLQGLLLKWNKVYNLTAVRDPEQIVYRHLFDSLTLVPYLQPSHKRLIDIGTGAGLPGLPLAIVCADKEFVLLDSNAKKTRFIVQCVAELGLENVQVETARIEDFIPQNRVDLVLSRAVTTMAQLIKKSSHVCQQNACFLFMKGTYPTEELESLPDGVIVRSVERAQVPGLDASRHIVHCCLEQQ